MPTLDDVYRKFGEVAEAAQLLETELGTKLLMMGCIELNLLDEPDPLKASKLYEQINKHTLGQMLRKLADKNTSCSDVDELLSQALAVRNRLAHSFYLRHNLRRNSEEGRTIMLQDLESMHEKLLAAYRAVLLLSGIDIDKVGAELSGVAQPTVHLPI
jgi:hypothetical protein